MRRLLTLSFCIIAVLTAVTTTFASTSHVAADCTQESVQAAVLGAVDGDVVRIPSGTCTWITKVAAQPSVLIEGVEIEIYGADEGMTTIVVATANDHPREVPFFVTGSKFFRISGITFEGTTGWKGAINVSGGFEGFRIDNCIFSDLGGVGVYLTIDATGHGVIDHNEFHESGTSGFIGIVVNGSDDGSSSWNTGYAYGGPLAVFVEDNLFEYAFKNDSAIQGNRGSRYVFRHNSVIGTAVDVHGACTSVRAGRAYEIYANHFTPGPDSPRAIALRGGSGVVFDNIFDPGYNHAVFLTNYRTCVGAGVDFCREFFDRCDGSSQLDGNQLSNGYPCLDQVGRSTAQTSEPLYSWNNSFGGSESSIKVSTEWEPECVAPRQVDHIQSQRDFFEALPKPEYEPFTYPHPLTLESDPPNPPGNLRLSQE